MQHLCAVTAASESAIWEYADSRCLAGRCDGARSRTTEALSGAGGRPVLDHERDIAHAVGITVGAVQKIINELERGGYLRHDRVGRRNTYEVISDLPLRHPLESHRNIGDLLTTLDE